METKKKTKRAIGKAANTPATEDSQYASRAVAKAFALLRILSRSGEHHTLSYLSLEVGLTKSSTFRLLQTLQALGQIKQDEEGRYVAAKEERSSRFGQIASMLIPIAREPMQQLQMRFKETVSLAVLFPNHIEVVSVIESPHMVRMANTVGRILPPHASSLGKAVAAHQPELTLEHLLKSYGLPRFTQSTIVDEMQVAREMQMIRERGYATEMEESVMDGYCYGVPIFLDTNAAVAAMSVSMPKSRALSEEQSKYLIAAMRDASVNISKRLKQAMKAVQ